jgi:dipeptidyl-peptidase-4
VDESPVAEVDRFEIYADSVKVIKQRYPAAGAKNATVQLFVKALSGEPASEAPAVHVDLGNNLDIYLARVNWFPNSASLAVQRQSRDQKTLALLQADASMSTMASFISWRTPSRRSNDTSTPCR